MSQIPGEEQSLDKYLFRKRHIIKVLLEWKQITSDRAGMDAATVRCYYSQSQRAEEKKLAEPG